MYVWIVVVGEYDCVVLEGYEILEKVDIFFVYFYYSFSWYYNDIVIVKLGNVVLVYMEFICFVCLLLVNDSYDGMICIVIGWGVVYSGEW